MALGHFLVFGCQGIIRYLTMKLLITVRRQLVGYPISTQSHAQAQVLCIRIY